MNVPDPNKPVDVLAEMRLRVARQPPFPWTHEKATIVTLTMLDGWIAEVERLQAVIASLATNFTTSSADTR